MLFHSFTFLVFAALFFCAWPLMRKRNASRWLFLVAASFLFYGWWRWEFLFLLLASGFLDFFAGLAIERFFRMRRLFLAISILGNVGVLVAFKYLDFLVGNLNALFGWASTSHQLGPYNLTLPIGISFYTFQSMSYTIDVYWEKIKPTRNPLHYFAYLSLFPQLVAGPIIRASHLLPQLTREQPTSEAQRWDGLRLITHGLFKKVVIADNLAPVVSQAFQADSVVGSSPFWWVMATMFAVQVYCDFSGYSDIARGLARWMGYDFPLNFNHPYIASSFKDFWGRWHISLTGWFQDYIYVPLTLSPWYRKYIYRPLKGHQRTSILGHPNLWVTLLISGLWHGAAWKFVAWGGLMAFYMHFEQVTNWPARLRRLPFGRIAVSIVLLAQIWVAWVVFVSPSLGRALEIIGTLFNFRLLNFWPIWTISEIALVAMSVSILREAYFFLKLDQLAWMHRRWRAQLDPAVVGLMIAGCIYLRGPGSAFIYFQF